MDLGGLPPAGQLAIHADPQGGVFRMIKSNPDFAI
jgi:hypothetical protein